MCVHGKRTCRSEGIQAGTTLRQLTYIRGAESFRSTCIGAMSPDAKEQV